MVILAHKIALNPTRSQERLLWEHVGYARFAANRAIEDFREGLDDGEWRNDKTLRPRWNARKAELAPWATHLSQNAAKNAIRNVGTAISRWGEYRRALREGRPARYIGFPRWRKRGGQVPGRGVRVRHPDCTAQAAVDRVIGASCSASCFVVTPGVR